jgi:leucyl aminopeptidase
MKFSIKTGNIAGIEAAILAVGLFEEDEAGVKALDEHLGGVIQDLISRKEFVGKSNQVAHIPTLGKLPAGRLLLVGLGKRDALTLDKIRQAGGKVATAARDAGFKVLTTPVLGEGIEGLPAPSVARAFLEGVQLGSYQYNRYKTLDRDKFKSLDEVVILAGSDADHELLEGALGEATAVAEAVVFSRDLVSAPPNDLTPSALAAAAQGIAETHGLTCKILTEVECAELKMGSFLGVAQGSMKDEPPRFIVLEYMPLGADVKPLVIVGKGITFDSGGISIKPSEGMEKMKYDMAGSAAALGAIKAIAALEVPLNVVMLVPATENMPSGDAIHPGDVLTAMNGITIEVVNTDAEGRLILADALAYAERYEPMGVVDLATLTGACVVALGNHAIGLMGNDDAWIEKVRQAGERAAERTWKLPLWDEYQEQIKSDIADIKNSGGRAGGTITAAAFLSKFTKKYPWAHLDIAGTAWDDKGKPYVPKGATGIGVRLLVELAEELAEAGEESAEA